MYNANINILITLLSFIFWQAVSSWQITGLSEYITVSAAICVVARQNKKIYKVLLYEVIFNKETIY